MLCKTTMRAALAHVLGIVGVVGAFGAGAQPGSPESKGLDGMIATEALADPFVITASPMGSIVIDETIDTLLIGGDHYLVIKFTGGAKLARELPTAYPSAGSRRVEDVAGTAGSTDGDAELTAKVDPVIGHSRGIRFYEFEAASNPEAGTDGTLPANATGNAGGITDVEGLTLSRAYRGDTTDSSGVYRMPVGSVTGPTAGQLDIDTHVRVELGLDGADGGTAGSGDGYLSIGSGEGTYGYELYIYEAIGDARVAAVGTPPGNYVYSGSGTLFSTASSLATAGASIKANLLTADVAHENGPFLGFDADEDTMTDEDVGNLATIMLTPDSFGDFLDMNAMALTSMALDGADIEVTTMAGNFGFGVGAGQGPNGEVRITGDDPETMEVEDDDNVLNAGGPPTAFMISRDATCMDNPLMLSNADGDAVDPNDEMDPVFSADATTGTASVTATADFLGPYYFCVLTTRGNMANEVQIPVVGDDRDLDGYTINVTTTGGDSSGPMETGNGGAIDRNGTTVNVTYLSLDPSYNQRLVIVNRSPRDADFWMDQFQTEEGTMISGEIRGVVMSGTRVVVDVQNVLMNNMGGQDRASGTLNLTAPNEHVDVMTVQVHPGTGQIDTTMY